MYRKSLFLRFSREICKGVVKSLRSISIRLCTILTGLQHSMRLISIRLIFWGIELCQNRDFCENQGFCDQHPETQGLVGELKFLPELVFNQISCWLKFQTCSMLRSLQRPVQIISSKRKKEVPIPKPFPGIPIFFSRHLVEQNFLFQVSSLW